MPFTLTLCWNLNMRNSECHFNIFCWLDVYNVVVFNIVENMIDCWLVKVHLLHLIYWIWSISDCSIIIYSTLIKWQKVVVVYVPMFLPFFFLGYGWLYKEHCWLFLAGQSHSPGVHIHWDKICKNPFNTLNFLLVGI